MATVSGNVFNKMREKGSDSIKNIKNQVASKGGLAIFIILALISIAVLIAYLIIKLKAVNTDGILVIDDPVKIYSMSSAIRADQSMIPATVNGQEFSFSMWLYIVEFDQSTNPKLVFMRSTSTSSISSANPIVAFDPLTNKMYVSVRTNLSTEALTLPESFYKMPPENTSKYVTARIDYFPMQRWVHVVGTVKDDSLSIYMNNSMYTVANVSDIMNATDSNPLRPIFAATTGSISVGNSGVESMNELKGFVAQFKFFNYALTTKDINSIYKVGPSSSTFLSRLGISGYGLRSPLYKVSAT